MAAMRIRALLLVAAAALLPSCGGKSGDGADSGFSYRATYSYLLRTGDTSGSGLVLYLSSVQDIEFLSSQTGVTQADGSGFISGVVVDGAGDPLEGVTVQAHNDAGAAVGPLFYQDDATGQYGVGSATEATGRFIVFNAAAGRVNLKCSAGANGNLYVLSRAGATVYAVIGATTPADTVTWSGVTQNLGGAGSALPGAAEESVTYQVLGTSGLTGTSGSGTGAISLGTVPAENTWIVKTTKTGFVPTFTVKRTETADLTAGAGGGNVFAVSETNRNAEMVPVGVTLTAGTGMIRGVVLDGAGGYAVEARDGDGNVVGEVWYGDNGDAGRPAASVTSTQSDGIFYIYNVPPGQVLVRAVRTDAAATAIVDVAADSLTLPLDFSPAARSQEVVSLSGALVTLSGAGVPEGFIELFGLPVSTKSDVFAEFTLVNVPTRHTTIVKTAK